MSATATITRPNTAHLLAFGATATVVALAVALLVRSTAANGAFWINQTLQVGTLASVAYGAGILVGTYGLKVNYARKISFFAIFLAPLVIVHLAPYHHSLETTGMRSLIGVGMFAMLAAPIRSRVPVLATMFRSFDRPEDRPHEHRDREQRERAGEKHVRGVPRVGRSAWATLPPIVPRLRIWKCPISGVASTRSGTAALSPAEDSISHCLVIAPILTPRSSTSIPRSSSRPLRSTRTSGLASRKFINGTRL